MRFEIALVVGDKDDPGFAAHAGEEYVVAEGFRESAKVRTLALS